MEGNPGKERVNFELFVFDKYEFKINAQENPPPTTLFQRVLQIPAELSSRQRKRIKTNSLKSAPSHLPIQSVEPYEP